MTGVGILNIMHHVLPVEAVERGTEILGFCHSACLLRGSRGIPAFVPIISQGFQENNLFPLSFGEIIPTQRQQNLYLHFGVGML